MRKPTTEEIPSPSTAACRSKWRRGTWPVERLYLLRDAETGLADWHSVPARKKWCYDIRPQALVEYNEHGGVKRYMALGRPPEKSNQLHS